MEDVELKAGNADEESRFPRIEIRNKKQGSPFTEIFINGHKLKGVRGYKMEHRAGQPPTLTLEINALNITVDEPALLFAEGFGEIEINFKEPSEDDSNTQRFSGADA